MCMRKGFTLIELMVVISIISLLSSVIFTSTNSIRISSRDSQRLLQVREFQKALEMYYYNEGGYPISYDMTAGTSFRAHTIESTNPEHWSKLVEAMKPYLNDFPVDPINDPASKYTFFSSYYTPLGEWYYLTYSLENPGIFEEQDGANSWGCAGSYLDNPNVIETGQLKNC